MRGLSLAVLLLCSLASCAALELSINNDSLQPSYAFSAGDQVSFEFSAENGTVITAIEVQTDNAVLEQAFTTALAPVELTTITGGVYTDKFTIPAELPSISSPVKLKIRYLTPDLVNQTFEVAFNLSIVGRNTNFWIRHANILPEDAQLVLYNHFTNYTVPRINPELQYWELNRDDVISLGYDPRVYSDLVASYNNGEAPQDLPVITKLSSTEAQATLETEFSPLGKQKPRLMITKNVFLVTHSSKNITKSKVIMSVYADDSFIPSGEVIISVPKEAAQNAGLLYPSEFPSVLKNDPVLKWSMKNVPQHQIKDYSYTASGDAQNFDTLAAAAADKPGLIARFLLWIFGGKQ